MSDGRLSAAAHGRDDAGGGGGFEQIAEHEGQQAHRQRFVNADEEGEPGQPEGIDDGVGDEQRSQRFGKRATPTEFHQPTSGERSGHKPDDVTARRSEQFRQPATPTRKDGQPNNAFQHIRHHNRRAVAATEQRTQKQNAKGLPRDGHGREGQRDANLSASDKQQVSGEQDSNPLGKRALPQPRSDNRHPTATSVEATGDRPNYGGQDDGETAASSEWRVANGRGKRQFALKSHCWSGYQPRRKSATTGKRQRVATGDWRLVKNGSE